MTKRLESRSDALLDRVVGKDRRHQAASGSGDARQGAVGEGTSVDAHDPPVGSDLHLEVGRRARGRGVGHPVGCRLDREVAELDGDIGGAARVHRLDGDRLLAGHFEVEGDRKSFRPDLVVKHRMQRVLVGVAGLVCERDGVGLGPD